MPAARPLYRIAHFGSADPAADDSFRASPQFAPVIASATTASHAQSERRYDNATTI